MAPLEEILQRENILPTESTVIVTGVSAAVCANAACLGFSNRHYMTLVPMDCQAAGTIEDEAAIYHKYSENTYAFTLSTMIEFDPEGMTTREIVEANRLVDRPILNDSKQIGGKQCGHPFPKP